MMSSSSSSSYLPRELQVEILEKLPVKSLLRFKCVCKSWLATIEDPQFARNQLENSQRSENKRGEIIFVQNYSGGSYSFYSVDTSSCQVRALQPPFEIPVQYYFARVFISRRDIEVCTCDGLLLLSQINQVNRWTPLIDWGTLILWNPITNKFRELPFPPPNSQYYETSVHGFGYDSSTQSYKIVRINQRLMYQHEVQVFTVKTNSWRTIRNFGDSKEYVYLERTVFLHGAVHFLRWNPNFEYEILCLNLSEERFTHFPLPLSNLPSIFELKIVGGRLNIHCSEGRNGEFVVWSMMEYGDSNSWARISYLPDDSSSYVPYSLMENGDLLVEEDDYLCLRDINKKVNRKVIQKKAEESTHDIMNQGMHSYVESLMTP